jgi:hypothetical protein
MGKAKPMPATAPRRMTSVYSVVNWKLLQTASKHKNVNDIIVQPSSNGKDDLLFTFY